MHLKALGVILSSVVGFAALQISNQPQGFVFYSGLCANTGKLVSKGRQFQKSRRKRQLKILGLVLGMLLLGGCSANKQQFSEVDRLEGSSPDNAATQAPEVPAADVISVRVTGSPNGYQFSVEVASPDEGCQQYADWWEVLTEDGSLVYRRILAHSHVDEQPFVRSGGPVPIEPETIVLVRAHMNSGGYNGKAMKGTTQTDFKEVELGANFAAAVESQTPQPTGCAF